MINYKISSKYEKIDKIVYTCTQMTDDRCLNSYNDNKTVVLVQHINKLYFV